MTHVMRQTSGDGDWPQALTCTRLRHDGVQHIIQYQAVAQVLSKSYCTMDTIIS